MEFEKWINYITNKKNLIQWRKLRMAIIDYSDMAEDIQQSEDPVILPKGTETKVRIIQVRTGTTDKDKDYFSPVYEVLGDGNEMVKEFSSFMWILDPEKLNAKEFERAKNEMRKFAACFGLDLSRPFDPEDDLVGLEGWVIVGVKKSDEYGDQNIVSKYILPR